MKRNWTIILIVVCLGLLPLLSYAGCTQHVDLRTMNNLVKAQDAFDHAKSPDDFLKVASMYNAAQQHGVVSGAILYNEGNALMRAGQRGRAIAAYRQAARYRPNDPYLEENLKHALGAGGELSPRRTIIGYLLFWQDWVSYPAKFYWAAIAAIITFVLGVIALYWHRRLATRLALLGLVVTGIFCFAAGYDWYRFDYQKHGVVVAPEVVARMGNAASYQPKFTQPLTEGTEFKVLERRGDWLFIRLPGEGNRDGWIEDKAAVVY